jgi:hypothetical protein
MRDHRRRRHPVVALDDRLDAVGRQHLERGPLRGCRQGVSVLTHVERAVDRLGLPVIADRLRDREDVGLRKRAAERRSAVPAGAESDALARVVHVRRAIEVLLLEPRHVDQQFPGRRLAGEGREARRTGDGIRHVLLSPRSQLN